MNARHLTHSKFRALRLMPRDMSPTRMSWPQLKTQVFMDLVRKDPARQRRQVRQRFDRALAQ